MATPDVKNLFYITHVDNVPSILERGILSHDRIESSRVQYTRIYDEEIVNRRKSKQTPNGRSLWDFANLFFQPRNPMMYRIVHEKGRDNLAVIAVRSSVLQTPKAIITDGKAANTPTAFFPADDGMSVLAANWKIIQSEWWNPGDGSKRRIMAECLVPDQVLPESIDTIYVARVEVKQKLEERLRQHKINIVPEPHMFFLPRSRWRVGKNISLVDGDMFFSDMQTLTISVNLQGIMGKGLASRAKYQFPDVYVVYQDACRTKRLRCNRPYLYKREASADQELADLETPLSSPNSVKWFLLFATKRKWREDSRLEDIEAGLNWLRINAQKEGVRSLALPALGCGLGNLNWAEVGPVMCRYLDGIGFDVAIYMPRERQIPNEQLTQEYLLT